jgi:hypothetical protein
MRTKGERKEGEEGNVISPHKQPLTLQHFTHYLQHSLHQPVTQYLHMQHFYLLATHATFYLALATQHKTQPSPQLVCLVLATMPTLSSDIQPPDKLSCLVFATTDTIPMPAGTRTITPDTINGNGLFGLNAKVGGILPQRGGEVPKGGDTPTTPLLRPCYTPVLPLLNPCNTLTPCILTCILNRHARCFDKYLQPCSDWLRLCGLSERNGGRYYL